MQVIKSSARVAAHNGCFFYYWSGNGSWLALVLVEIVKMSTREAAQDGFV